MYAPPGVATAPDFPIADRMRAWILGGPGEIGLGEKPVPVPGPAEVLVRIDAVAICATDLEVIEFGSPAQSRSRKSWCYCQAPTARQADPTCLRPR